MCCITFNWATGDYIRKVANFKKTKSLVWAVVEVTDVCNFNCIWCYAKSDNHIPRHMDKKQLRMLLDTFASSGIKQVTFSGGEPTLYPNLIWAVRYANKRGIVVHLNSNGFLLSRKLLTRLKRAGLSQIQVNIDSIKPEKHDEIRGRIGSFERAATSLMDANELGITAVVQTVLTKENQEEALSILRLARLFGAKRFRLWDMMLSGSAIDKSDIRPDKYMQILRDVSRYARKNGAISMECGEPLFPLDYKIGLDIIDSYCVCAAGLLLNVSSGGDAYFCCTYRKPLYNVFDSMKNGEDIREVHKEKLKGFLSSLGIIEGCKSCDFYEKCRGGCLTRTDFKKGIKDYWCEKQSG